MALVCQCPAATALPSIGKDACAEAFGQVQRIAFQRLSGAAFTSSTIGKLTNWTSALSETDDDKIVVSGYVNAPDFEAGGARTYGGGNDSLDGIEEVIGADPTTFSGQLRNVPNTKIKLYKQLMCEAKAGNLGVYFFNGNNQVLCGTNYGAIPIRNLFVGDKDLGGLDEPDVNALSFSLLPDWSDNTDIFDLEFNPNTDLA